MKVPLASLAFPVLWPFPHAVEVLVIGGCGRSTTFRLGWKPTPRGRAAQA